MDELKFGVATMYLTVKLKSVQRPCAVRFMTIDEYTDGKTISTVKGDVKVFKNYDT